MHSQDFKRGLQPITTDFPVRMPGHFRPSISQPAMALDEPSEKLLDTQGGLQQTVDP